jgi:hypothetical protein
VVSIWYQKQLTVNCNGTYHVVPLPGYEEKTQRYKNQKMAVSASRRRYIVLSDEEENDDGLNYGTPLSSPLRSFEVLSLSPSPQKKSSSIETRQQPKTEPRSLARKGRTRAVRQVSYLKSRVEELKGFAVSPTQSFLMSDWNGEVGKEEHLHPELKTPRENAAILFRRGMAVVEYFKQHFTYVSNPYFGKTVNLRSRFNKHMVVKKKEKEMIVMIALTVLGEEDIPIQDKERCEHTVDSWAMAMERLIINLAKRTGVPLYEGSSDVGGGGKAGADDTAYVTIYLLLSISNE